MTTEAADEAPADRAAVDRAHALFDPIAAEYLERPDVDIGPMFGSEGLRVRGKVFAFVGYRAALIVKVPESRADELIAAGDAERMQMRGREMREWVVVDQTRSAAWPSAVADAFEFVDRITP